MATKYCPLYPAQHKWCLEDQCAWWDDLAKSCAILVIAKLGGCGSEGSYHNVPIKKEDKK